jgi:hypothetical protein
MVGEYMITPKGYHSGFIITQLKIPVLYTRQFIQDAINFHAVNGAVLTDLIDKFSVHNADTFLE